MDKLVHVVDSNTFYLKKKKKRLQRHNRTEQRQIDCGLFYLSV